MQVATSKRNPTGAVFLEKCVIAQSSCSLGTADPVTPTPSMTPSTMITAGFALMMSDVHGLINLAVSCTTNPPPPREQSARWSFQEKGAVHAHFFAAGARLHAGSSRMSFPPSTSRRMRAKPTAHPHAQRLPVRGTPTTEPPLSPACGVQHALAQIACAFD